MHLDIAVQVEFESKVSKRFITCCFQALNGAQGASPIYESEEIMVHRGPPPFTKPTRFQLGGVQLVSTCTALP